MIAYLIRSITGRIQQNSRPVPARIHYIDVLATDIPLYVQAFLGRSDKTVPTQRLMPFERFVERLNSFSEGFVRKSVALKFGNNHVDPLAGLRRSFFVQTSEWKPRPEQIHPDVIRYTDAVASDLRFAYRNLFEKENQNLFKSNITFADQQAITWLRNHEHLIDAPCDKGLGCALLTRLKYDSLASCCLEKSYREIDNFFVLTLFAKFVTKQGKSGIFVLVMIYYMRSSSLTSLAYSIYQYAYRGEGFW